LIHFYKRKWVSLKKTKTKKNESKKKSTKSADDKANQSLDDFLETWDESDVADEESTNSASPTTESSKGKADKSIDSEQPELEQSHRKITSKI